MKVLAFHAATTGMIQYKDSEGNSVRSNHPSQPHIVRLAAILYNTTTNKSEENMDVIVRPEGWEIEPGAIAVHGLTNQVAILNGIYENVALEMFLSLWGRCDLRIAHSAAFDNRIIRIALNRYRPNAIPDEVWKDKNLSFCTMVNAKVEGKKTLSNVHKHYIGHDFARTGDTMSEASAALEIYLAMNRAV